MFEIKLVLKGVNIVAGRKMLSNDTNYVQLTGKMTPPRDILGKIRASALQNSLT